MADRKNTPAMPRGESVQSHHAPSVTMDSAQRGSVDPWRLVHAHRPTATEQQTLESLFALSNGMLGVRGGLEEQNSPSQGSFLTGVWERTPIEYHERFPGFARTSDTRIPVPDGTRIGLRLGSTLVDLGEGEWLAFEQALDLRAGHLQRTLHWRSPTGVTLQIDAERIVPLHTPNLLCIRYRVTSLDYSGPITLESALVASNTAAEQGEDPRMGARVAGGLSITASDADHTLASICQRTQNSHIRLACGQRHRIIESKLAFAHAIIDDAEGVQQHYTAELQPGGSVVLEKYVAYAWSRPEGGDSSASLLDAMAVTLESALTQDFDTHLANQASVCDAFWQEADLRIEGPALQPVPYSAIHRPRWQR
jgi:trehalose/maltose hydrolase-like predicted phosphorylase